MNSHPFNQENLIWQLGNMRAARRRFFDKAGVTPFSQRNQRHRTHQMPPDNDRHTLTGINQPTEPKWPPHNSPKSAAKPPANRHYPHSCLTPRGFVQSDFNEVAPNTAPPRRRCATSQKPLDSLAWFVVIRSLCTRFGEVSMGTAIQITRFDFDAVGLRREARRTTDVAASRRMLALALVLEGASRADAAKAAGMDRQTLRDWVHRFNEQGLAGLSDKTGNVGPKPLLSPEQEREVAEWVRRGPDLAEHGVIRWRRADLARAIAAKFGVVLAERSMSDVLRRMGFRRLVARPRHPGHNAAAQASFRATSPPS